MEVYKESSKTTTLQNGLTVTLKKSYSWSIQMQSADFLHESMNSEDEINDFCKSDDSSDYFQHGDVSNEIYSEQVFLQKMPTRMYSPKVKRNRKDEEGHPCPICAESFGTTPLLLGHMLSHTGEKPHLCDFCGSGYARQSDLQAHARIHLNKELSCKVCKRTFTSVNVLKKHTCNLDRNVWICSICGKRFQDEMELIKHLPFHRERKKHMNSSPKEIRRHVCEVCGKSFAQSSTLKIHKRTHTGEKPFACSICGSRFIRRDALNHHAQTHSGEKPYTCTICGKMFTKSYSLTIHKRSHMGEKHNMCDVCGKLFSRAYHLQRHRDTHSGEKPYACEVCGKAFAQVSGLKMHATIHSGEKPHKCAVCNKGFARAWHLKRHYETHERQSTKSRYSKEVTSAISADNSGRHVATNDSNTSLVTCEVIG